jgi:rubrerythrin
MNRTRLTDLLVQSLEHERGGVQIYRAALTCAANEDLRKEWSEYLEQTQRHVQIMERVCRKLEIDPEEMTPGRKIVHDLGVSLVAAIEAARTAGDPAGAQIVACECVVLAETKDHADWELMGKCAKALSGSERTALMEAYDEVEDQEDEHLYHTKGWCRELWLESLELEAVLPPPEERKHVTTAIGAALAEKESDVTRQ